jgi:hypothetical protein
MLFFDNLAAVEVAIHKQRRHGERKQNHDDVSCDLCMSLREKLGSLLSTPKSTQRKQVLNNGGLGNLEAMPASTTLKHQGRGRDQCGQATKGMWGMSGRQKARKGVEDCDKPGGAVNRALRPGCPNHRVLNP